MSNEKTPLLLQLSAGKGPDECGRAVALAVKRLQQECQQQGILSEIVDGEAADVSRSFRHVLVALTGDGVETFAKRWSGSMMWNCVSPFRPKHKRKNWFFSGEIFSSFATQGDVNKADVVFSSCRASGAGGQHVNTTDSAVRAKHLPTGIDVRVESQRSQHANKKLALLLLGHKLQQQLQLKVDGQKQRQWQQHQQLQRGNPTRIFRGEQFIE